MKTIYELVIKRLAAWLYGGTAAQWEWFKTMVKLAEGYFESGPAKLTWVKTQIVQALESPAGREMLGGLSQRAVNWFIEMAVNFISKK